MALKLNKIGANIVFYILLTYLIYHAFSGERGIKALVTLKNEHTKLYSELEQIRAERIEFEHKVSLMRSESLDLDLLEEQARSVLGLANKKEKVIFNPQVDHLRGS